VWTTANWFSFNKCSLISHRLLAFSVSPLSTGSGSVLQKHKLFWHKINFELKLTNINGWSTVLNCVELGCSRFTAHSQIANEQLHTSTSSTLRQAQLLQTDSATLRVIEYFAKLLNVIRNNTGACKSLLVFHWKYVCISYRLWDIQHQRIAWPWNWGHGSFQGYWKWCRSIDHIRLSIGRPL